MKRESGYYWVKLPASDWEIAEYSQTYERWTLMGNRSHPHHSDETFKIINETRIKNPDEK